MTNGVQTGGRDVRPAVSGTGTDPVTIAFAQHIDATDPLRTGIYTKAFTVSTTAP
jgi:hypothetical protein